jgi:hypothetical protein
MRVGFRDLTAWSFIMASAHGAGLMLVPVLLKLSGTMHEMEHRAHEEHEHWGHGLHLFLTNPEALASFVAVAVHTLAIFAVMAAVALVVYDRLGLMILKRTWFNADLIRAGALVGAGVISPVPGYRYVAETWSDSPRLADELGASIVDGTKTATCSAHWEYGAEGSTLPEVGLKTMVLD